jgi:site-specific DNA-methyltransferase (adenine-specific)
MASKLETNVLYYGDNLDVLRKHIPDESIDLIYLDPPFNSNRSYNVLFKESSGAGSEAQIEAFGDTWHWGRHAQEAYEELMVSPHQSVARILRAMMEGLGHNDVTAYLTMMAIRLVELHRKLKPTGSMYLHCDPTAGDYLKVLMDAVFGPRNFRNQIVWKRSHPHGNISRKFGSIHDLLLFYVRDSAKAKWNQPAIRHQSSDPKILKQYNRWDDERQDWWQPTSLLNPNPDRPNLTYEFHGHTKVWRWTPERMRGMELQGLIYVPADGGIPRLKRYLSEQRGMLLQDIWNDIEPVTGEEALGYETQKPVELLERVVSACTDEGDIVLDPFCGCGTAVHAAEKLGRKWIGIDITHLAISLIRRRMQDAFPGIAINVIGEPVDLGGARELAARDKYQFQWWVLDRIGAQPVSGKKKGADKGIDGVIPFYESQQTDFKRVLVSVKGGEKVGPSMMRDLRGVIEREKEPIGVFVTLARPSADMTKEAAGAGFYQNDFWKKKYPRIQILTVEQILKGKLPDMPPQRSPFAQAPLEREQAKQPRLV